MKFIKRLKKKYNDLLNLKFEKYKYEIEYEKIKKKMGIIYIFYTKPVIAFWSNFAIFCIIVTFINCLELNKYKNKQ